MRFSAIIPIILALAASHSTCFDFTNIHSASPSSSPLSQAQTLHHDNTRDSVLYNVSSLGLSDPFANFSTHLTYDSKVEIGDPHNNQKGSVLTLLNGTIYPLGSVGAIGAIGWEGDSNDTDVSLEQATRTKAGQVKKNGNGSGGLSGIWLAFTSQDAITGGYTLNNETLTTSNNLIYQNLTFLSNFTIHQDGSYSFAFSFATLHQGTETKQQQHSLPSCVEEKDDKKKGDHKFKMTCTGKRKKD